MKTVRVVLNGETHNLAKKINELPIGHEFTMENIGTTPGGIAALRGCGAIVGTSYAKRSHKKFGQIRRYKIVEHVDIVILGDAVERVSPRDTPLRKYPMDQLHHILFFQWGRK